jgi:hypothetical protein
MFHGQILARNQAAAPAPVHSLFKVPRDFQWNSGYAPLNRYGCLDACSSADSPCSAGFQPDVSQISNLQYVAAKMALKSSSDSLSSRTPFRSMSGRRQFGKWLHSTENSEVPKKRPGDESPGRSDEVCPPSLQTVRSAERPTTTTTVAQPLSQVKPLYQPQNRQQSQHSTTPAPVSFK